MAFKRASPEEKAARDQEKAVREEQKAREREAAARKKMREDFFTSPAGQARIAYETGAHVFQYSLDVHKTHAVVVKMVGAYARPASTTDPSVILNSVCNEGWDLVNGSFVFLELGSESRDKFLASGQQVAHEGLDRLLLPLPTLRREQEADARSLGGAESARGAAPESAWGYGSKGRRHGCSPRRAPTAGCTGGTIVWTVASEVSC